MGRRIDVIHKLDMEMSWLQHRWSVLLKRKMKVFKAKTWREYDGKIRERREVENVPTVQRFIQP